MSEQNSNGTCGDGKEMKGLDSIGLRAGQTRTRALSDGSVVIRGNCVITKKPHTITVYSDELEKWLTGNCLIQDALRTDVSADDREVLMTGISPEGWETIFPKTGMSGVVGDEIK